MLKMAELPHHSGLLASVWATEKGRERTTGCLLCCVLEVEGKCAVTHLTEPKQGLEGTPLPTRKLIGPLSP